MINAAIEAEGTKKDAGGAYRRRRRKGMAV
jgi:hypothetical protein